MIQTGATAPIRAAGQCPAVQGVRQGYVFIAVLVKVRVAAEACVSILASLPGWTLLPRNDTSLIVPPVDLVCDEVPVPLPGTLEIGAGSEWISTNFVRHVASPFDVCSLTPVSSSPY